MADYIYLLQNRLSAMQQAALQTIRDVAKAHGVTVFMVGGAVRDLTSGSPVRDLDVVVQGNALKLKKDIEATGAMLAGEVAAWQAFFVRFPGGVQVEIGSTLSVTYPKPGKPVAQAATILDDLRRRDFTANAMALSLNDGSYGLLMDPLNGVADIENRQLRLVSNYGFIEDPVRMIRATRYAARLGWTMDEKTQARYETGKAERYIGALSNVHRGYETEEIFHEEDPLRVLRKLEEEGWMKHLFPAMTAVKANAAELDRLREVQTQLQVSGINPDPSAANFPLLTTKLSAAELTELKKSFVRQGFVREVEHLELEAKEFATQLSGKSAALPSQAWKLIHAAKPEAVLWVAYSSKSPAIQTKLKSFYTEWPKARQKIPFALMAEMRIVPELDIFNEVAEKVFFELMDGNLATPEEQKAFLEPFSPPAPPPPVRLARSRANKKDSKGAKGKKKLAELPDEDENIDLDRDEDRDFEKAEPLPDDENENTKPVIPFVDEGAEETIAAPVVEPEPTPVLEAERTPLTEARPISAPTPAQAAPKPKRAKPITAIIEPPPPVETTPPASAKAESSKPAVKLNAPVMKVPPGKTPRNESAASIGTDKATKLVIKTASASAKKATLSASPIQTSKPAQEHPQPAKKTSAKQAPAQANNAVLRNSTPPAKIPSRKAASTPEKTAGKKER